MAPQDSHPASVTSTHPPFLPGTARQQPPSRALQTGPAGNDDAGIGTALAANAELGQQEGSSLQQRAFLSQRLRTSVMVNLVSVMERMDEQVLPAVTRFLACSFTATPHQLGQITFGRALVQACASPLGGFAGHYFDRVVVLTVGCCMWAFFTACFAFSRNLHEGMFFWAFNGIGLSLMIPNAQSLVADYYPSTLRGRAFGALQLTSALGGMAGTLYATNISSHVVLHMAGWRFAFLSVAMLSGFIGILTLVLATDPRHAGAGARRMAALAGGMAPSISMRIDKQRAAAAAAVAVHPSVSDAEAEPLLLPGSLVENDSPAGGGRSNSSINSSNSSSTLPGTAEALSSSGMPHTSQRSSQGAQHGSGPAGHPPTLPAAPALSNASINMPPSSSQQQGSWGLDSLDRSGTDAGEDRPLLSHGAGEVGQLSPHASRPGVSKRRAGGSSAVPPDSATAGSISSSSSNSNATAVSGHAQAVARKAGSQVKAGKAKGDGEDEREVLLGLSELPAPRPHVPEELTLKRLLGMFRIPTFLVIILQGVVGSLPWNALVFLTLYLQLLGMSDFAASVLMALLLAGTAGGALLGGWIGDTASKHYPNAGRIAVTQFSVFVGVPACYIIFKVLPLNGQPLTVIMYGVALLITGILHSWAAPACNNPIFAEIVPTDLRNMVYAFDRSFEGAISAMGAPLVGLAAEKWFGFNGTATAGGCPGGSGGSPDVPPLGPEPYEPDLDKASALGSALLLFTAVPWACCTLLYTGLYYTYPRDRENAAAAGLAAEAVPVYDTTHKGAADIPAADDV